MMAARGSDEPLILGPTESDSAEWLPDMDSNRD